MFFFSDGLKPPTGELSILVWPCFIFLVIVARFGTHLAKRLDEVGGTFFFCFSKTVFLF